MTQSRLFVNKNQSKGLLCDLCRFVDPTPDLNSAREPKVQVQQEKPKWLLDSMALLFGGFPPPKPGSLHVWPFRGFRSESNYRSRGSTPGPPNTDTIRLSVSRAFKLCFNNCRGSFRTRGIRTMLFADDYAS